MIGVPLSELDDHVMAGIVGSVSAFSQAELEEVAEMNLTFNEYTAISPAINQMDALLSNPALAIFTRNLCTLMYRMGQQNATRLAEEGT